jgi:hypothetical protein
MNPRRPDTAGLTESPSGATTARGQRACVGGGVAATTGGGRGLTELEELEAAAAVLAISLVPPCGRSCRLRGSAAPPSPPRPGACACICAQPRLDREKNGPETQCVEP